MERLAETLGPFEFEDSGNFQTLAGFVMHCLGRIPAVGDSFESAGFSFEVVEMDLRRVDRVVVTRMG